MTLKKATFMLAAAVLLAGCSGAQKWTVEEKDGYNLIHQEKGPVLGYSPSSGVQILTKKGLAFKDLNKNGRLDVYEDWRRSAEDRARDLASKLTIDEIAGLMLYSDHQAVPGPELTDVQRKFLAEDNVRAVLITSVKDTRTAAQWNNNMQAFVEGVGHGVPGNTSSDPRNGSRADMKTVEQQLEDLPFDMVCYKDVDGNTYDFGYGLNWSGVISDARTKKYTKK